MQKRRCLCRLGPQRQRVVGEMVVQVDQPGQHKRAADINDLGTC
jgi:hypothetical protein